MNKHFVLLFSLILLMTGAGLVACGGDDDNVEQSEIIDGVNVVKGKKLTEVRISKPESGSSKKANVYKVEYDSKNRLSRIVEINYEKGESFEILKIDYDLREFQWLKRYKEKLNLMFMLNQNGYISQMNNCSCEYNNEGYLTGGYNNSRILQIGRDEGEIIQSVIEELRFGNISTNYFNYDNDKDSGVLIITIDASDTKYYYHDDYDRFETNKVFLIPCLVAYQAGLFGKTDIHVNSLPKTSMTRAIVKKIYSDYVFIFECELKFE